MHTENEQEEFDFFTKLETEEAQKFVNSYSEEFKDKINDNPSIKK